MKKTIYSIILILAGTVVAVKQADAQVFSVGVSIRVGPPVIPVYVQPPCPVEGYLWVPGYWAYDDDYGYYWVPGYWAEPPIVGFLWTPGYWGYVGGIYRWNAGYWGPHIGFYGGVNYGCGYYGSGYAGGAWVGGRFRYNTAVTNVNTTIVHNTYIDRTVVRNVTVNRVSYNGGPGGINARPNAAQEQALRDRHVQATSTQLSHQHNASVDRNQFASVNHGRPSQAAVQRPTAYHPANTTAGLSRAAARNRPTNNVNHAAPAARPAPMVDRGVRREAPVVNRPQPMRSQPSRQMERPQPVRSEPSRPVERPQPVRTEPSRPMAHPQPMHTEPFRPQPMHNNPQPMRRPQPMQRQQPVRPAGHPQPPRGGGGEHHPR